MSLTEIGGTSTQKRAPWFRSIIKPVLSSKLRINCEWSEYFNFQREVGKYDINMAGDNVCKIFFALKCKTEEAASFESGKIISSFLTSAKKMGF